MNPGGASAERVERVERVEGRLRAVEEAQAFDQRTLEQLHELVLELGKRVDTLTRRVAALERDAARGRDGMEGDEPGGAPGAGLIDPGLEEQ